MDAFTAAYVEAALWSTVAGDGGCLDKNYGVEDIAPATLARIEADCAKFQAENAHLIADANCHYKLCPVEAYAGHDFWLTRNHHSCGFWDGDWTAEAGKSLTEAAGKYREVELYVGDDGLIHEGNE